MGNQPLETGWEELLGSLFGSGEGLRREAVRGHRLRLGPAAGSVGHSHFEAKAGRGALML